MDCNLYLYSCPKANVPINISAATPVDNLTTMVIFILPKCDKLNLRYKLLRKNGRIFINYYRFVAVSWTVFKQIGSQSRQKGGSSANKYTYRY